MKIIDSHLIDRAIKCFNIVCVWNIDQQRLSVESISVATLQIMSKCTNEKKKQAVDVCLCVDFLMTFLFKKSCLNLHLSLNIMAKFTLFFADIYHLSFKY